MPDELGRRDVERMIDERSNAQILKYERDYAMPRHAENQTLLAAIRTTQGSVQAKLVEIGGDGNGHKGKLGRMQDSIDSLIRERNVERGERKRGTQIRDAFTWILGTLGTLALIFEIISKLRH